MSETTGTTTPSRGKPTRKPQDHKMPKDKPRTVTVRGVDITIDPNIFDDLDIVESLYDMQHADTDPDAGFQIIPFLRKLTGPAYGKVKAQLRDPQTGRIGMDTVGTFIQELMSEIAPNS